MIDINLYRQVVGCHIQSKSSTNFRQKKCIFSCLCLYNNHISFILALLLLICGDVHPHPGPSTMKQLSIIHLNVCSVKDKLDTLEAEFGSYDVLCITETWLHDGISSNDILIPGFHPPFRKDRQGRGGGVAVYVSQNLIAESMNNLTIPGLEAIWIKLRCKHKNYLIGTFYRADKSEQYWELIEDSISNAADLNMQTIVTGDFNENILREMSANIQHIELINDLTQIIKEPTRITPNSSTLIDLIFVSSADTVLDSGVLDPVCSDHCPVFVTLKEPIKSKSTIYKRKVYDYNLAEIDDIANELNTFDWETIFSKDDINCVASDFTDVMIELCDKHIPNKIVTIRPQDAPWMNNLTRKLMRKRNRFHKIAKRRNLPSDWANFRSLRNKVISSIRNAKKQYVSKIDDRINNEHGTKTWWRLIKHYLKTKQKINSIPSIIHNDIMYEDSTEIANIMNEFFTSQTSVPSPNKDIPEYNSNINNPLSEIHINPHEVYDILYSVDTTKATGPDGISNKFLKMNASLLAAPAAQLFNLSLKQKIFPTIWKEASVVPIYKKGERSKCSNYRPVALTSCFAKILEKCIFKHVFNYLRDNNMLSDLQSGFMPGDSTVNQLTYLYDFIAGALDKGKEIRAVFCDVSKAFDKVWHKGIIQKLKRCGIRGDLLDWFESYLENRLQCVVINGYTSDTRPVFAGVPQGSVLGPLLFIVYINDITEDINSNIRLFADDTSLYIIIDDPIENAACLNDDLQIIADWANTWQVTFNPEKTESIHFTRKVHKIIQPDLIMSNSIIKEVESHKHLGLNLQNDCLWNSHICEIVEKITPMINCLRSLKYRLTRQTLETMYQHFILPTFDYCCHIWDNCSKQQAQILEKLHLDALRTICGAVRGTSHNKIYEETNFQCLSSRRNVQKLLMFYKMVNKLTPVYLSDLIPPRISDITDYCLRDCSRFQTKKCNTVTYEKSFLPDTVKLWNSLPDNVKQSETLGSFKKKINQYPISNHFDLNFGSRFCQIIHSRLRLGCSDLNAHKFERHISSFANCSCGYQLEDCLHFFFVCNKYTELRNAMFFYKNGYNLKSVLFGHPNRSSFENSQILSSVHSFITLSGRFEL